ncbi:hypothetical protein [Paenibacillus soyae]|uniref:Uncharacterized protein n=1 Tax=Paenibacillus soyae TaxID=2969249 RepID=A0A9X2SAN4_9BACL|nr:hypothetical protein [Paenibacillus soyae]MCR2803812.1 hypothetical protein [Paenibacillus soyae]
MIKLLKYDWKRNATAITAMFCILIAVQIGFSVFAWYRDYDPTVQYVISSMLYAFCGFLAFIAACMTFNANLKSYSRRLLPLPSLYTVLSCFVLLLATHAVLAGLYFLHDWIYRLLFDIETLSALAAEHLTIIHALSILLAYVFGLASTTIVIFFGVAIARMFEGKLGIFLGIAACIAIYSLVGWLGEILFPFRESSMSLVFLQVDFANHGPGNEEVTFIPFENMRLGEVLYELLYNSVLLYGILYIMDRKTKL